MAITNNRTDTYISNAADFAQPILRYLRQTVHQACPLAEEAIKWSFPCFSYKGSILCSMASFKKHCAFGFWLASLMDDPDNILPQGERDGMGHLGKIKTIKDLPSQKILTKYIKNAMKLIDNGAKLEKKSTVPKKELVVPEFIIAALKRNKRALDTFMSFPYSHKKEYVEWITEAKTEPTRMKRTEQMLEWLQEGKSRNWKYEKK